MLIGPLFSSYYLNQTHLGLNYSKANIAPASIDDNTSVTNLDP